MFYPVEFEEYSTGAYSPLMLLKCMLLQKWFHIPSDPELENQICPVKWVAYFFGVAFNMFRGSKLLAYA